MKVWTQNTMPNYGFLANSTRSPKYLISCNKMLDIEKAGILYSCTILLLIITTANTDIVPGPECPFCVNLLNPHNNTKRWAPHVPPAQIERQAQLG